MKLYRQYHQRPESPPVHWRDQANLSAEETIPPARPWISAPDGLARRDARDPKPPPQGTSEAGRVVVRADGLDVKKGLRLRHRSEFQSAVQGHRFHSGPALVGFAVPNTRSDSRIGVTV